MAATYKDIQRLTGLSLATISKYFNGGRVREENKKVIEQAIETLDFHVNAYARGLKSKRSYLVGGLIPELDNTFNTRMMADVEGYLRQHGYGFMVCDCRLDREMEREALDFLLDRMVDGIITIPYERSGLHLKRAEERGVPVVLMDRLATELDADAVTLDNYGAGRMAAEELIRCGHRNIAIINGPHSLYTMQERMQGFQETLRMRRLPVRPEWMLEGKMTVDGGYQAFKQLYALWNKPTALFCANYEITLGAVMAINEMGVRVPEDLSLIGFDNLLLSQVIKPQLTMVKQPMEAMAKQAADLLMARIEQKEKPERRTRLEMAAELVIGDSVRSI